MARCAPEPCLLVHGPRTGYIYMHGILALVSLQPSAVSLNSQYENRAEVSQLLQGGVMRRHALLADRFRCILLLAPTVVLMFAAASDGIRLEPADVKPVHGQLKKSATQAGDGGGGLPLLQEEVRATGSSLPDCTHACGACSPCSRVMVSFKCSVAEPLPCPMVYRCMCRGKCYPVPSS